MAVIEERIDKDGLKVFRVRIRIKGHKPLSATFRRKTDARQWAAQTEQELRHRIHFGDRVDPGRSLRDLIDRYLNDELPKRRSNKVNLRKHLQWWRDEIGHLQVKDVTPAVLAGARDKLLKSPVEATVSRNAGEGRKQERLKSPATVTWYMASMSSVLTLAVKEWEWLDTNPMLKVRKPELPQSRVRFLDDAERQRLLQACKASYSPYLYTVIVLALSTGARKSEIMNLRWRDIDFDRGQARLQSTKNRERRTLPLTHHAIEVVEELYRQSKKEETDFLFPRSDGLAPIEIRKAWTAAVKAAELEDFHFHDLRHSAASYLAMNGATLAEIAEVLGHKTLQMVKRYAHLSDQHVAAVVDRMNRAIFTEPANDNMPEEPQRKGRGRK